MWSVIRRGEVGGYYGYWLFNWSNKDVLKRTVVMAAQLVK